MARVMEIVTPLGPDALLFHRMHATEEISRLSEYQLDLLSTRGDINLDEILGKNVTVKLALPDDKYRYFNGYVTRFSQSGKYGRYHRYLATVRPWLWLLTRTADCRIFQEMTVPDILKQVFGDHSAADFKSELTGTYGKWNYCVQYRETDFNFVSRLMEQEGICYYFRHVEGRHTLVLADSYSHAPYVGYEELRFIAPEHLARAEQEHINAWDFGREIQPGMYVHDDYDAERPSVELLTRKAITRKHSFADAEIYDYPGEYLLKPDGEQYAAVRLDEFSTQFEIARGATNARGMSVGYLFKLNDQPRADQNREYLVMSANYDLEFGEYEGMPDGSGANYQCRFVVMSSQQQFRPRRATPKPMVQGPQTAVVVGPGRRGDLHRQVRPREGAVPLGPLRQERREQLVLDARVAALGRQGLGLRYRHPAHRPGGDRRLPGRRPRSADHHRPRLQRRESAALRTARRSGASAASSRTRTKGRATTRLSMDDTAGKEKITIHGQYDMNTTVEHDQTTTVHNNRTDKIDVDDSETVGNNQTCSVGVDQSTKVGSNRNLNVGANQTTTIGGNHSVTVSKSETATVALQRTHSVGINETISVGAAQEISVGAMQVVSVGVNQTVNVGASQSTSVGANQSITVGASQTTKVSSNASTTVGGDQSNNITGGRSSSIGKDDSIKAGKNFVVDAGDSITIKTGSASITMKKDGTITIKGKDISIDGSGKINVKASSDITMKGSKITQN